MTLPMPYSDGGPSAHNLPAHIFPASAVPTYPGPEVQVGDVRVTGQAIYTPVGVWPVRGSRWMIVSQPMPIVTTAGWGIGLAVTCAVLAVVLAIFTCGLSLFLLLGLLFLTARTHTMSGPVVVSIQAGNNHYLAQEIVYSQQHAVEAIQRINFAQAIASQF